MKHLDIHLIYMGVWFFGCTLLLALLLRSPWPIVACACGMQMPLITRMLDKHRRPYWRPYFLANELLVLGMAFASAAVVLIVQR